MTTLPFKTAIAIIVPATFLLIPALPMNRAQQHSSHTVLLSVTGRYDLAAPQRCIPLKPQSADSLRKQLDSLAPDRDLYLVLSGLQSSRPPGILYAVHLQASSSDTPADSSRVGYINFYSVSAGSKAGQFSFDVTQPMRALLRSKSDLSSLHVCLVPSGRPEATPSIGSIQLVSY